jgi:hypothetical protein
MAATVTIAEFNTAGETETASITNTNMGSTDAVNLVAATYPIVPGENSYEKWQKIKVTNLGGSTSVGNFKVWRTGALGGSAAHVTNARTTSYGGAETFATPIATASTIADQTMPSSEPATSNLGVGGTLAAVLTDTGASDYLVHQIQTDAGDTAGSSTTMNYQYDEVA